MADGSVELRWDSGQIRALLTGPTGPVGREMIRRGNRVLNRARQNAPVDRGDLRASGHLSPIDVIGDALSVRVTFSAGHATVVHEGHGVIRPVRGEFLRWPNRGGGGGYVYARQVRAVAGRPFLRDALEAARD